VNPNKHNKFKWLLIITLVLIMLFSLSVGVLGDVGNHNDYSSGSDYDYDSGSDGDSSFIVDIIIWVLLALPFPLNIIVIGVIAFFAYRFYKREIKTSGSTVVKSDGNTRRVVPDNTASIESAIKNYDSQFSSGKFLGWSEEVFMTIQQAWTSRDWDKIRPFEKEELYRKHQLQLQEYINNGTINVVERINVNQTYLYKYVRDAEYEYLTVYLQARMNDYIIDENTKQVVRGDRDKEYHTKYLLTFMRKTGVVTNPATSNMSTKQCPHCGAPLAITSAGKCEYCDTIVTTGEFDWVLSDLDSIKSSTNIGPGGVQINE